MKSMRINVNVYDGNESASVSWSDNDPTVQLQLTNGGQCSIGAKCAELLYEALHEIFGSKS